MTNNWPYPKWIAHRGAGILAPENTMAAFRLGASMGYRMFECDAKLSADGVIFLLHDASLERTTNGQGIGGDWNWSELSQLDAGSWHSPIYAGEPLATLKNLAQFCIANAYDLNIEIKPTPGLGVETGRRVAQMAHELWQSHPQKPLLSSFDIDALQSAQQTAPHLHRGLLLDVMRDDWIDIATQLECSAVVCNYKLWNAPRVASVHQAGMNALSYTVNEVDAVTHLLDLKTDGTFTDRVDLLKPSSP
ncbi:MAG: glycerophosphodiester phosphodiesterase [Limnohabitans sp.]|nr:glycerophosphodiester phosphodiesterase [Limnohabitans sp.]